MDIRTEFMNLQSYATLQPIAEEAVVNLSFWGSRYVTIPGYEGYLHIDDIAQRVTEFVRNNPDFNEDERLIGQKLANEVSRIYTEIDNLVDGSNFITRILAKIRDIHTEGWKRYPSYSCSQMRWIWKKMDCIEWHTYRDIFFEYYTKNQYETVFNEEVPKKWSWYFESDKRWKYEKPEEKPIIVELQMIEELQIIADGFRINFYAPKACLSNLE